MSLKNESEQVVKDRVIRRPDGKPFRIVLRNWQPQQ